MNAKYEVAFLILNYNTPLLTVKTVEKLFVNQNKQDFCVVIVDNGSYDDSIEILEREYIDNPRVYLLKSDDNKGFAKGNNQGYSYIRKNSLGRFVVCMNSDVIIEQKDFIEKIVSRYNQKKYHVLGPDVIIPNGEHRNPHRDKPLGLKDLTRIIINRRIILLYIEIKKILRIEEQVNVLENLADKLAKKERLEVERDHEKENVVVHGCCIVFSPDYINSEEQAFCDDTFLYMEEDILCYCSIKKGYTVLYYPEVSVYHIENASTDNMKGLRFKQLEFFSRNILDSAKVYRRIIKNG